MRVIMIVIFLILTGCAIEPEPISYGKDMCHFCSMTIVDDQHASEMVTSKGRAYKYDAIECMINDIANNDYGEISLLLVSDYSNPGALVNVDKSIFLVSQSIPSPMGAYLSAFSVKDDAEKKRTDGEDQIYSWDEIKSKLAQN